MKKVAVLAALAVGVSVAGCATSSAEDEAYSSIIDRTSTGDYQVNAYIQAIADTVHDADADTAEARLHYASGRYCAAHRFVDNIDENQKTRLDASIHAAHDYLYRLLPDDNVREIFSIEYETDCDVRGSVGTLQDPSESKWGRDE